MPFDPDRVSTVTFDSFSTIVDVTTAKKALVGVVENPEAVTRHWRSRALNYTLVSNHIDGYQPFSEINRDALDHALSSHGISLTQSEREEVLGVFGELDVFPDVRPGIERLTEAGYECYIISNGDPEMLTAMVQHASIQDLIEDTIIADEVEMFKPSPEIYRHAAARTGTPITEIAHASAGWFDNMGVRHVGMQGVWMDRQGNTWETFDGDPDLIVNTIPELADAVGA